MGTTSSSSPCAVQGRRSSLTRQSILFSFALVFIVLGACTAPCEAATSLKKSTDVHANQVKLLRYVQRVSAAMEGLVSPQGSGATTTIRNPLGKSPSSAEAQTRASNESGRGLSAEQRALAASSGALPGWLEAPQRWLQQTTTAAVDTMSRMGRLIHVAAGGALSAEEEESFQARIRGRSTSSASSSLSSTPSFTTIDAIRASSSIQMPSSTMSRTPEAATAQARDAFPLADDDTTYGDEDTDTPLSGSCSNGGKRLLSTSSVVRCTAEDGSEANLTALEYSQQEASQKNCTLVSATAVECLCPPGFYAVKHSNGHHTCTERDINVMPRLPESQLCYDAAAAEVGLPATRLDEYCITTTRQAILTLNVTWYYEVVSDNTRDTTITAGNETGTFVVLPTDTVDTLSELRSTVFASDLWSNESSLQIVSDHAFFNTSYAFSQVYCFSSPMLALPYRQSVVLMASNATAYIGGANGSASHTVSINLAEIPDKLIEGNQMYIETGIHGEHVRNVYRVARLHVRFSDLSVPAARYHYSRPMNVLYVALIVLVCLLVASVALVVLWCLCTRETPDEDDVVSRTVRKREEQKTTSVKKKA